MDPSGSKEVTDGAMTGKSVMGFAQFCTSKRHFQNPWLCNLRLSILYGSLMFSRVVSLSALEFLSLSEFWKEASPSSEDSPMLGKNYPSDIMVPRVDYDLRTCLLNTNVLAYTKGRNSLTIIVSLTNSLS